MSRRADREGISQYVQKLIAKQAPFDVRTFNRVAYWRNAMIEEKAKGSKATSIMCYNRAKRCLYLARQFRRSPLP